jgi:hypothetical protein
MQKYTRPTKQFDFIGKALSKLDQTQRALTRRTNYKGTPFTGGVGAGADGSTPPQVAKELTIDWDKNAEGFELKGPTFITFTTEGQALLQFKVTDDFHYVWYSNQRYYIDHVGKIERE